MADKEDKEDKEEEEEEEEEEQQQQLALADWVCAAWQPPPVVPLPLTQRLWVWLLTNPFVQLALCRMHRLVGTATLSAADAAAATRRSPPPSRSPPPPRRSCRTG